MAQYINKNALEAELKKLNDEAKIYLSDFGCGRLSICKELMNFLDALEVKEVQEEPASTAYIVTRCKEHSEYVEEVFFDEDKAQKYCDQFKGNENEYARHITKVKVTL